MTEVGRGYDGRVEAREIARAFGLARIGFGAAFIALPGLTGRTWVGADAARPGAKVFMRGLGARDLALGLGTVIALDRGAPVRGWLEGSLLADSTDLAATLLAGDDLPAGGRAFVFTVASTAIATGAWLIKLLD